MRPVAHIIGVVGAHYGISGIDIRSVRRDADTVWARHIAIWLARELTSYSMPKIGAIFGGRDHTTVLHAIRRIDMMREVDAAVREETNALFAAINAEMTDGTVGDRIVQLAYRLLEMPAAQRSASGEQIGLLCSELIRLAGREITENEEETAHD